MPIYRSRRIRLPDFMWQALTVLTDHVNEAAISDPDDYIGVSGLIETLMLTSVKVSTLRAIAEHSPDFQRAITAWVEWQIARDPARRGDLFAAPLDVHANGRTDRWLRKNASIIPAAVTLLILTDADTGRKGSGEQRLHPDPSPKATATGQSAGSRTVKL